MNHVLNNNKVACFTQKHSVAKLLSTGQLMNVFAQAQVCHCHNDIHTSYGIPYYIIYKQQNLSTWNPFRVSTLIAHQYQDLNLKCR